MTPTERLIAALSTALSPRSAEALVLPEGEAAERLVGAAGGETKPSRVTGKVSPGAAEFFSGKGDPVLSMMVQRILQAAQARPETVAVRATAPPDPHLGTYYPGEGRIDVTSFPTTHGTMKVSGIPSAPASLNYQQTLGHELLHFLLRGARQETSTAPILGETGTPQDVESQHAIIKYLLGGTLAGVEKPTPPFKEVSILPGTTPPFAPESLQSLTPEQHKAALRVIAQMFQAKEAEPPMAPPPRTPVQPSFIEYIRSIFAPAFSGRRAGAMTSSGPRG